MRHHLLLFPEFFLECSTTFPGHCLIAFFWFEFQLCSFLLLIFLRNFACHLFLKGTGFALPPPMHVDIDQKAESGSGVQFCFLLLFAQKNIHKIPKFLNLSKISHETHTGFRHHQNDVVIDCGFDRANFLFFPSVHSLLLCGIPFIRSKCHASGSLTMTMTLAATAYARNSLATTLLSINQMSRRKIYFRIR